MGRRQATGKGGGRRAAYKRGGNSSYQRKSTMDASVLGLGGGVVPLLGGGAMNLASLLGGGGLQTQINLLTAVSWVALLRVSLVSMACRMSLLDCVHF